MSETLGGLEMSAGLRTFSAALQIHSRSFCCFHTLTHPEHLLPTSTEATAQKCSLSDFCLQREAKSESSLVCTTFPEIRATLTTCLLSRANEYIMTE